MRAFANRADRFINFILMLDGQIARFMEQYEQISKDNHASTNSSEEQRS